MIPEESMGEDSEEQPIGEMERITRGSERGWERCKEKGERERERERGRGREGEEDNQL